MGIALQDWYIERVCNAAAAAQTELVNTTGIDMAGYDGCLFICPLGDVSDTCALTLTIKQDTVVSGGTPTAITGGATTLFTAGATSADNKELVVDVAGQAITKRYLYASLTRTTANAVVNGIYCIKYKAKNKAVTQPATVIASASAAS